MADPVSLTLALITAFKEVYLLSRCIYRACESAKASEEERAKLRQDLRFELIYIQSFGRYYLKSKSIADDDRLDKYWIIVIRDIFEDLRKSFSDYSKLDDPQYLKWSPYVNDSTYNTAQIEFPLDEEIPPPDASEPVLTAPTTGAATTTVTQNPTKSSVLGLLFHRPKAAAQTTPKFEKTTVHSIFKSAKWALYDKAKLDSIVHDFRKQREKLRDSLVMAQSAQFSKLDDSVLALSTTIVDRDANKLGLVPHAKLIQLNEEDDDSVAEDYSIEDRKLKIASTESDLTAGFLEKMSTGNGQTDPDPESVLVELKQYPPSTGNTDTPDEETVANVHRLAGLLKISSCILRTLPFQGYINQLDQTRYAFIYGYPENALRAQPVTLHSLIKSSDPQQRFSLKTRFDVAQKLAQSIGVFHADRWVHKSVSSQAVVFFKHRTQKSLMVDSPYLVDFEYSRPERGRTYASYNKTAEAVAVYLHPDRPRMTFTKLHDIYALGIVLLEIATWTTARDHFEMAAQGLNLETESIGKEETREKFISIARKSIPYYMGTSYMEAVVACLDDTYKGQTGGALFPQTFQREIVDKLSAKNLVQPE